MSDPFLLCLVCSALITSLALDTCPESCQCHGDILKCSPKTNSGVKLRSLPPDLSKYNLDYIKRVNLSGNSLQLIESGDFLGLPKSNKLDLRHNRLRALLQNGFKGLDHLVTLELSHNLIAYIDRFAFNGLQRIRRIDLSHNEITFIEDDAFRTDRELHVFHSLVLSFNKLHDLDDGTFTELQSLKELYLNNNAIERVNVAVFTPLLSLEMLYMGHNVINCTCDWLDVLDSLDLRDIEIMDISDTLELCGSDVGNCHTEQGPVEAKSSNNAPTELSGSHRIATYMTAEELRPPATDEHGRIVAGDGNSFPLWSPEGERVLSDYDTEMRRRIARVEPAARRRAYSLVFQHRMREFLESMKTGRNYTEFISRYDSEDSATSRPVSLPVASRKSTVDDATRSLIDNVVRLIFPFDRKINVSQTPPEREWAPYMIRTFDDFRASIKRANGEVSTHGLNSTVERPTPTLRNATRVLQDELMRDGFSRRETAIPVFFLIGFVGVFCICAAAVSLYSGLCASDVHDEGSGDSGYCQCKWMSTLAEKLSIRKQQIERQKQHAGLAKSGFLLLHNQAKQTMESSGATTERSSPEKVPTMVDEQGVVSVTPLVLTDDFADKTDQQSAQTKQQTSWGLYSRFVNYLYPNPDAQTTGIGQDSPGDEITLFEVAPPSTSESQTSYAGATARDELPTNQNNSPSAACNPAGNFSNSSNVGIDASDEKQLLLDNNCSETELKVDRTSSDLRWYARECLSNQRMMSNARTMSMKSSDDVKSGENEDDTMSW